MKKRVIIIGSGLGGLSTALILQRQGFDTLVLEQCHQIGGCLQCFTRPGARFETGMHFIGSADKGQTLWRLLRFLEIEDKIVLSRLDTAGYDTIYLAGQKFSIPNGEEPFIERLSEYFPSEKDAIAQYYNLSSKIAQASHLNTIDTSSNDLSVSVTYQLRSVNEVIESITSNPTLQNVLVSQQPLYAGIRDHTPFSTHAFIFDFYNKSAFRVVGGSDCIAQALRRNLEKYGGQVHTLKRVTKVICDDEKVTGVEVNGEDFIPADYVISAIHPARLIEMTPTPLLRPAFRKRMTTMPNTVGCFSLYVKFKPGTIPYSNTNHFAYKGLSPWNCDDYTEETWPKGYLYMHQCPHADMKWAETASVISYMKFDEVATWRGTRIGRRSEAYEALKEEKCRILINAVEKDFPGFAASIDRYWAATPLTFEDYTGTLNGGMYGVAKDIQLGIAGHVPQRTKVPNLLQTGQNVNSHGILGTLVGSIVTSGELLGSEKIVQLIQKSQI